MAQSAAHPVAALARAGYRTEYTTGNTAGKYYWCWMAINIGSSILIGGAPLVLLLVTWVVINYRDDYYAVTNLRVTRRDRQLLMYETARRSTLEMVQNVTVNVDFWGNVFRYGDVSISTAAKAARVCISACPQSLESSGAYLDRPG